MSQDKPELEEICMFKLLSQKDLEEGKDEYTDPDCVKCDGTRQYADQIECPYYIPERRVIEIKKNGGLLPSCLE